MKGKALALVVLALVLWPRAASAYIDPGTGSAAYQILLAGLLGVGYALRRLVSVWRHKFARRPPDDK